MSTRSCGVGVADELMLDQRRLTVLAAGGIELIPSTTVNSMIRRFQAS